MLGVAVRALTLHLGKGGCEQRTLGEMVGIPISHLLHDGGVEQAGLW